MTRQRRVIIDVLHKHHEHPTADEVYRLVRRRIPRISLGTVYRNLELLARCGRIRKLRLGGPQMRFDADTGAHSHIRCTSCGRIVDVSFGGEIPPCDVDVLRSTGFDLVERRVEFIGICPDCKKGESETGS